MISASRSIAVAALALLVAGARVASKGERAAAIGSSCSSTRASPDLAAATVVAERDCTARRGREAYLLTAPSAPGASAPAGPRSAVFSCSEVARRQGGGNQAAGGR